MRNKTFLKRSGTKQECPSNHLFKILLQALAKAAKTKNKQTKQYIEVEGKNKTVFFRRYIRCRQSDRTGKNFLGLRSDNYYVAGFKIHMQS